MARPAKLRIDPLITALFARVPPAGQMWPPERHKAWLALAEAVFTEVYGTAMPPSRPAPLSPSMPFLKETATPKWGITAQSNDGFLTGAPTPSAGFYIDKKGYVRRPGGARVLPEEVTGEVIDRRPNGDLRSIIWADESTGLNGRDLVISSG